MHVDNEGIIYYTLNIPANKEDIIYYTHIMHVPYQCIIYYAAKRFEQFKIITHYQWIGHEPKLHFTSKGDKGFEHALKEWLIFLFWLEKRK